MLECRIVRSRLGIEQRGVLSLLPWYIVIYKLLTDFDSKGYEVFGFADDILIMVKDKVDLVLLSVRKTVGISFTRRRKQSLKIQ
jgi:hypothetical protein